MDKIPNFLFSAQSSRLSGEAKIPGDKSISHRALMIGSLCIGETEIEGLLEANDVSSTANAMKALGVKISKKRRSLWGIHGVGIGGFSEPPNIIDCGNSGTSVRLLMGAVSTNPIKVTFTGDSSLRSRPMLRVVEPLSQFGATFSCNSGKKLPIHVNGSSRSMPIR